MSTMLHDQAKRGLVILKRLQGRAVRRKTPIYKGLVLVVICLLLSVTAYASFHTSSYFSTDSDAIIATQQFSGGLASRPVTLPGVHSNLLIIPLLLVQGHLPYHYASFTLVNMGLVVATITAWAYLLIKLCGRKYEVPILLLLSTLVFTSVTFNINIEYTTLRNIEYPIALGFVFIVSRLLKGLTYSPRQLALMIIGTILFSIVLAGDDLFNYAILGPILLSIVWYWLQSRKFTAAMGKAIGLIVGVFISAALIKFLLRVTGLIIFDNKTLTTSVVSFDNFWPSVSLALRQLMELQEGFIFGQGVGLRNLSIFINFGILVASITGLVLILLKTNRNYKVTNSFTKNNNFIFVSMAISFFMVFMVYILSGLVVTQLSNGQLVDSQNARYISFLPLIAIIGFIWLLKNYYRDHNGLLITLCIVLFVGIVSSYANVSATYRLDAQITANDRTSLNNIITELKYNNVHEVVTDYWYGPPIKFWSGNTINFAPQTGCNQPLPFSSLKGWFTPQKNIKSALINAGNWDCSDAQLVQIYGKPIKELRAAGITTGSSVDILIYNYDVRQRLLPLQATN